MRKYMVYVDDCEITMKVPVLAKNKKSAIEQLKGNGEVICVKDVTDEFNISLEHVMNALRAYGFGRYEMSFIADCLSQNEVAN